MTARTSGVGLRVSAAFRGHGLYSNQRPADSIAGVGARKDSHTVVFLDGLGKVVKTFVIAATTAGYQSAIETAKTLDGLVVWGLENTGADALDAQAIAEAILREPDRRPRFDAFVTLAVTSRTCAIGRRGRETPVKLAPDAGLEPATR